MALFGRSRRGERRGTPVDALIVGLGNPGKDYANTRHNVGEMVVRVLADRAGATLKAGRDQSLTAETTVAGHRVVLAFPLTYMNESGRAVAALVRRFGIDEPQQIVIVHDELDLAPNVLRIKAGGGLAGHNGLRSIAQQLGTQDFLRVRIGVGKPPSKERGASHVLSRVPASQREELQVTVNEAADAVELILTDGVDAAMRQFHSPRP